MAASEIGFNRDAFGCPSVREADGTVGAGPHRPSGYCNLEPIVHQPLPLTPRNFRPGLHPDILTPRDEGRHGCGFDPEQDALFAVHGPVPPLVRNPLAAAGGEPQLGGRTGKPSSTGSRQGLSRGMLLA